MHLVETSWPQEVAFHYHMQVLLTTQLSSAMALLCCPAVACTNLKSRGETLTSVTKYCLKLGFDHCWFI